MGVLVDVRSRRFLLQREDHAAAVAALHQLAQDRPDELCDPGGVLAADELVAALRAGDWIVDRDEHGDVTSLCYGADKAPSDASTGWPFALMAALAPHVRWGTLIQTTEGDSGCLVHTFEDHRPGYRRYENYLEIVPTGPPPRGRPGATVTVDFTIRDRSERDGAITLADTHSAQIDATTEPPPLRPGEPGRVQATVRPGAAGTATLHYAMERDGLDCGSGRLDVQVDEPPGRADLCHAVVARASMLDQDPNWVMVATARLPLALRALRRYAIRHQDRPGAEFLRGVAAATDVGAALRAASLEARFGEAGLIGVGFIGDRLPGYERYLAGLFWSMPDIIEHDAWFRVAYADDPDTWVQLAYEWRQPERHCTSRE